MLAISCVSPCCCVSVAAVMIFYIKHALSIRWFIGYGCKKAFVVRGSYLCEKF